MKHLQRFRALALVGALVAATWFVVLPAFASTAGQAVLPPSTGGVTPTNVKAKDAPDDCKLFYPAGSRPAYSFRIKDGASKTYTDSKSGATFTLTLNPANTGNPSNGGGTWPAYGKNTYFSFTSTGAAIVDVGVDGDNEIDTTRYSYSGRTTGFVTSDGYLHASALSTDRSGNTTKLDGLDDMSFCYNVVAPVKGTVYQDPNQNGQDDNEPAQGGWTVSLYKGNALIGSTSSDSNGLYTLYAPVSSTATYTVCETAPSGTWAQTEPLPSSADVCASPLRKGHSIQALSTAPITGIDFGNVPAATCTDGSPNPDYTVKVDCTGKGAFFYGSGQDASDNPFVSVFAADSTQSVTPVAEKIVFPNHYLPDGTFAYTKLAYTDTFPVNPANVQPMPACLIDPRDPSGPDGLTLLGTYGTVLPAGATSCVISASSYVDASGNAWFVAYVYSSIDGWRGGV